MGADSVNSTIRKVVCDMYRGSCDDIRELEEEDVHSSVQNSELVAKKSKKLFESEQLKENNHADSNNHLKIKSRQNDKCVTPTYPWPLCAKSTRRGSQHDEIIAKMAFYKIRNERQAQSINLNSFSGKLENICGSDFRSLSNPTLDGRVNSGSIDTKVYEDDHKSNARWVDANGKEQQGAFQNPKPKNEDHNINLNKTRNFNLNKLFKRTLNSTTQIFKNKDKPYVRVENINRSTFYTSRDEKKQKLNNGRVNITFMDTLNLKQTPLHSFDHQIENESSMKSFNMRSSNRSKSRDHFRHVQS